MCRCRCCRTGCGCGASAALESLLRTLGAKLTMIDAPFEPEGGAYAARMGTGITTMGTVMITRTTMVSGHGK